MDFKVHSDYKPKGDQGRAIEQLARGIFDGEKHQVLLGVTGSGKTFSMAKIIEAANRPALILAHNKTLAAQLYHEFKAFFPNNAVEYFVSYYDYYQPEAYIPASDVYIEKEATINDELDKLRLSATRSLFERRDCIIVASVSCIYGLGSPEAYYGMLLFLEKGQRMKREDIVRKLVEILYERTNEDFKRGTFRVRGDVIEIFPTYDDNAYRIEMFGDEIETLAQIDPLFGTRAEIRDVQPAQVLDLGDARIIDVREPDEFSGELGHIEGAALISMETLSTVSRQWRRDEPLLFVCRSGTRSSQAARIFAAAGFSNVMNLVGGMRAWNEAGLPVVSARSRDMS